MVASTSASSSSASTSAAVNGAGGGGGGATQQPPRSPRTRPHPTPRRTPSSTTSTSTTAPSSASTTAPLPNSIAHEISQYLATSFLPEVVPTQEEYEAKEQAWIGLQSLVERLWPSARLLPFGSMANGFALKNSDMDLCCLLGDDTPPIAPSLCVEQLGRLISEETPYYVKTLPRARIPIIKLTLLPSPDAPWQGVLSCDIGFENRLALENTRLLHTYASVDPRVRAMVLFLKVWTKRRQINNPYRGTLSSYGFVLLVIHFLAHVKSPPVIPNLQRIPPLRPYTVDELEYDGHDISFFSDLEALPRVWQSLNTEGVGELLIDFFRYFSKDFNYNAFVVSIRSEVGILSKDSKGWATDHIEYEPEIIVRDMHKLCIEDPFQLDYNVARTVTKDGLYTIRGEFMRAVRILSTTRIPDRISSLINELCMEREDSLTIHPPHDRGGGGSGGGGGGGGGGGASPRRRSAPSPRSSMAHPPTSNGFGSNSNGVVGGGGAGNVPMSMADLRLWAATSGHSAEHLQRSLLEPMMNGGMPVGGGAGSGRNGGAGGGGGGGAGVGLEDAWEPRANTYHPHPPSYNNGRGSAHFHYPSYGRSHPAAAVPQPSLERRISWDGSGTTSGVPYDLHRFFQSRPADHERNAATAPSSPDLSSASNYRPPLFGFAPVTASGRTPYGLQPNRNRMASVPRNHHYTSGGSGGLPPPPPALAPSLCLSATENEARIMFGTFASSIYGGTQSSVSEFSAGEEEEEEEEEGGEDEEDDFGRDRLVRGRTLSSSGSRIGVGLGVGALETTAATAGGGGVPRPRGRSVPHVRVDSNGRESILFGEIQVTLPSAPKVTCSVVGGTGTGTTNGVVGSSYRSAASRSRPTTPPSPALSSGQVSSSTSSSSLSSSSPPLPPAPSSLPVIPQIHMLPPTPVKEGTIKLLSPPAPVGTEGKEEDGEEAEVGDKTPSL